MEIMGVMEDLVMPLMLMLLIMESLLNLNIPMYLEKKEKFLNAQLKMENIILVLILKL